MNRENTEKLCKKFPILYQGRNMDIRENLMPFGFECGDGWYKLIYELSKKIEKYNKKLKKDEHPCIAVQVKEKFGSLRFYVCGGNDEIFKLINKAEEDSYKICEKCGKPGKCNDEGWLTTLCDFCRKHKHMQCYVCPALKENETDYYCPKHTIKYMNKCSCGKLKHKRNKYCVQCLKDREWFFIGFKVKKNLENIISKKFRNYEFEIKEMGNSTYIKLISDVSNDVLIDIKQLLDNITFFNPE